MILYSILSVVPSLTSRHCVPGEKPHPCDVCGKPFRVRSDMKRHMQTHNREVHPGSAPTPATATAGNSQSSQGSEQAELPEMEPVAAEITVQDVEESMASQPLAIPATEREEGAAETPQQISEQQLSAEEVQEEVMQYSRDPLETVRDGPNTLYVWPIYMA